MKNYGDMSKKVFHLITYMMYKCQDYVLRAISIKNMIKNVHLNNV